MKNLSIKVRLIILGFVTVFGVLSIHFSAKILNDQEKRLFIIKMEANTIKEHILIIRKHEKDFLSRLDVKYEKALHDEITKLKEHLEELITLAKNEDIHYDDLIEIQKITDRYKHIFDQLVSLDKKIGLTHEDGLRGAMRNAIHEAESFFKKVSDFKMQTLMLTLRRNEKDFLIRLSPKYIDSHAKNFQKAIEYINSTKGSDVDLSSSLPLMKIYENSFKNIANAYMQKGLDEKSGVLGELRNTVHQTEGFVGQASQKIQTQIDEHIKKQSVFISS